MKLSSSIPIRGQSAYQAANPNQPLQVDSLYDCHDDALVSILNGAMKRLHVEIQIQMTPTNGLRKSFASALLTKSKIS